jgi:hypothetical protein
MPDENPGEFRALLAQWIEAYEPASTIESDLLAMVVSDLIRIRRCRRLQDAQEARLGPRGWLNDPKGTEVLGTRRDSERTFHANYKRLLELRKRPRPTAARLETSLRSRPQAQNRPVV